MNNLEKWVMNEMIKNLQEYEGVRTHLDILFSHPERFKLAVTILLAQQLDSLSPYIAKRIERDEEFILTPLTIKTIINEWQVAMNYKE